MEFGGQQLIGQEHTFTLEDRMLGRGTFGTVYAATDQPRLTEATKQYAVKICPRKLSSEQEAQTQLAGFEKGPA